MLRRNSSKSSRRSRLSRSKSTSSITRNPVQDLQLFDPVIAERDAHIAARLSYQRAHNQTMAYPQGDGRSGPSNTSSALRFERSNSNRLKARSEGAASRQGILDDNTDDIHGLKHQKSIRFAGPSARPRRNLASRATEHQMPTSSSVSKLSMAETTIVHRGSRNFGSRNRDSSFTLTSVSPLHSLASEHGVSQPDDVQSQRQVRKSRSMFTSSDQFDSLFQSTVKEDKDGQDTVPSRSRYAVLNKENERATPPLSTTPSLRAPKSMSFLRSRRDHSSSQSGTRLDNDLAVQLAREKFKEQVESQSKLKSQPSLFFRSKNRRTESSMGLRKSLRNSSNTSAALSSAFSGDSLSVPKAGSLRTTARKVSQTLKTKFKGIFGRKSSEGSAVGARDSDGESSFNLPAPLGRDREEASMSRGPSRIASIQEMQPCQRIRSCEGSIESCDEEDGRSDERSRVTSWTDSVTNTMMSQPACGDWERQRLSVIKENGMHVSSPAIDRRGINYAVVEQPSPVDSQRVYSALMRRANEAQRREQEVRQQSVDEMRSHGRAPPRSSSVDQFESFPGSPPTIRCVESDDGDVFEDKTHSAQSGKSLEASTDNVTGPTTAGFSTDYMRPASPPRPLYAMDDESPWNAAAMADFNQKKAEYERSRIVDRSSAFFASPANHFFRTQSPFRRALHENMKTAALGHGHGDGVTETGHLGSLSEISLPARQPSVTGSDKGTIKNADAESMYSYGEDDLQGRDTRYLVDRFPHPPLSHSSTGISSRLGQSRSGQHLGQRAISAASSVE